MNDWSAVISTKGMFFIYKYKAFYHVFSVILAALLITFMLLMHTGLPQVGKIVAYLAEIKWIQLKAAALG